MVKGLPNKNRRPALLASVESALVPGLKKHLLRDRVGKGRVSAEQLANLFHASEAGLIEGVLHCGCDADTSSCEPLRERDLFLFCCRFTGHSCLVVNRRPPRARALPRPNRAGPNRPRVFTLSHTTRLFTTERKWRPIKRKKSAAGEASRRADAAGAVHRSARGVRAAAGGIRAPSGSGRNEGGGLASAPIERQQHRLQVRLPPPPPPPPRSPSFPPCVVWCARTPQRTAASPPLPSVAPPLCWPLREFPATQRLSPGLTA